MKRRPSSQLWKQIFGIGSLWVVAQRRKTEGCVQIVGETECRILQGEREREGESGGFEHFSRFLVYRYSFF